MLRKILSIVSILLVLFLLAGILLPRHVHIERSIAIERPAATIFVLLNSYKTFTAWSPWAAKDPDAVYEYSGPASGVGARMSWSGDPRLVGNGWQEIIASQPYSMVRTHLDFDQQGQADAYFQISEAASGVHLTWGSIPIFSRGRVFWVAYLQNISVCFLTGGSVPITNRAWQT